MFAIFLHPKNLSQKMMRVILSIYLVVMCLITSLQFLTEYMRTKNSILNELKQLEETVSGPIAANLWQYNQKQLTVLITGLVAMPIIVGVDVLDKHAENIISKRTYMPGSTPLSIFDTQTDLHWMLHDKKILMGSLILYSSSQVILDRVLFGFKLIALTAIIKLSIFVLSFCLGL